MQEVYWGAALVRKGGEQSQAEGGVEPWSRGNPMESLNMGPPSSYVPNQGKGHGLCHPQVSVIGHGCLGRREDFLELSIFLWLEQPTPWAAGGRSAIIVLHA